MELSPLAVAFSVAAGMLSFALSYGMNFGLSFCLKVLMSFGMSAFAGYLLIAVNAIMSDVISNLETISWTLQELLKTAKFSAEKLCYIESRIDSAQSTCRDTLRHVYQHLTEFDIDKGGEEVLKRWLVSERDQWLMRCLQLANSSQPANQPHQPANLPANRISQSTCQPTS